MGLKLNKFLLLMWKNWILQLRHPVQTIFEILVPVFFCMILVVVRSLVESDVKKEIRFDSFDPLHSLNENVTESFKRRIMELTLQPEYATIAYSPDHEVIRNIMENSNLIPHFTDLRAFKNNAEVEASMLTNQRIYAGIVFDDSIKNDVLTEKIHIKIRFPAELRGPPSDYIVETWKTNILFPLLQLAGAREPRNNKTASPSYYYQNFLAIQELVSQSIIRYIHGDYNNKSITNSVQEHRNYTFPKILMNRYPYPDYISDPLLQVLQQMIGLIIVLAFVYTSISIIKIITTEKEKQLKESMKIMGLPGWLHWTAWFIKSLTFMLISIIIMVLLFKIDAWYPEGYAAVFPKCDPIILFIFLLLFSCSTITLCFAISTFFSKANMAAGIGGVLFFLFYVPYTMLQNKYQELTLSTKLAASLMSNSAMGYGFQLICLFESTEEGLQWNNMWRTVTPDDNLVMGHILLMLILDSIIYMLIALYVEAVMPGKYGIPKKWNFIFTSMFSDNRSIGVEEGSEIVHDPLTFEREPKSLKKGIEIKHLKKVYAHNKAAVRDFSLNMFEDQITVLLGHNGAGKTTTMSMLTGMFPPTSGTAIINGFDIRNEINSVRSSLGLCPQHNILFDELTVSEHIYFYSKLKGMPSDQIDAEIDEYVKLLDIEDKRNKKSHTLSGGMKRKLSVAVAFCGDSKVIMLDEPTAGMDPAARRALWELVQTQKKGRTIMLTTHFMDEADLLGDRIAIMAGGELQCCGSSFFLKKKYGAGYHLIMDKSSNCDTERVTTLLRVHIPNIQIENNVGSELTYLLNESDSAVFQDMLKDVESNSESLGIRSYGISLTTLEEVFMKVGADFGQEEINDVKDRLATTTQNGLAQNGTVQNGVMDNGIEQNGIETVNLDRHSSETQLDIGHNILLTGFKLRKNQIRAMFMKRFLTTLRSWPLFIVQILIPILLLIFAILSGRSQPGNKDLPSLDIKLDAYYDTMTVLQNNGSEYFENSVEYLKNKGFNIKDITGKNMTTEMIAITKSSPSKVRMSYIVGASFHENETATAWFNNDPYHSPPLALNLLMNTFLKNVNKRVNKSYEITVSNSPLAYSLNSTLRFLQQGNNMGFQLAINIGFCMSFISAFYVLFYIRERVCKVKHLQFVSGINIILFWTVNYIWDWMTYAITIIFLLITLLCFQEGGFKSADDIGRLAVIFLYFGFAMLPLIYLVSFIFELPSSGFIRVILFTIILGTFAFMVVEILSFEAFDLTYIADILDWLFLFIPHYALSSGIRNVNLEYEKYAACQKILKMCILAPEVIQAECAKCKGIEENYFVWKKPGILRNIIISLIVGVVLIVILFMIEYKIFARIKYYLQDKNKKNIDLPNDDSDVLEENERIRNMTPAQISQQTLVLKDVTKYYKKFLAVNGLCLGVNRFECFGLLGVNGAGKTTTFKMMTGDEHISYGDAYVNGLDLKSQLEEVNKLTGYCPQFDALLDDLTGAEIIKLFCLLRGFTEKDCGYIASKLARDFDFHRHLDKQVKQMSGGNKRKLSTAVALIGDPPILYLDEPTTGMDPATKRNLWNSLCKIRDSGKCLILTSHSMEECEALCTRLAIMVNGRFKCLGSTQHLKNKFSEGYSLTIKFRKLQSASGERSSLTNAIEVSSNKIEEFIKEKFPTSILREKHQELVTFYLPDTSIAWSTMFGVMENAKDTLNIEDYSLGQSSLEQVFLTFTQSQAPEKE